MTSYNEPFVQLVEITILRILIQVMQTMSKLMQCGAACQAAKRDADPACAQPGIMIDNAIHGCPACEPGAGWTHDDNNGFGCAQILPIAFHIMVP